MDPLGGILLLAAAAGLAALPVVEMDLDPGPHLFVLVRGLLF